MASSTSMTESRWCPSSRLNVESALGSQPICMTRLPMSARQADSVEVTVDLPMPPLP